MEGNITYILQLVIHFCSSFCQFQRPLLCVYHNIKIEIYFWNHVYLLCKILPIYPWLYFCILDSDYLLGSGSDGMHRRAIFATKVEPDRDKFNVKSTCKPYLFCVIHVY